MVAEWRERLLEISETNKGAEGYKKTPLLGGIVIRSGFREVGIGTEMMKASIEEGWAMG